MLRAPPRFVLHTLAAPGETCWRIERAERLCFVVDAAAYFEAFVQALERAQRQVLVVGWDIDSRVQLTRHGVAGAAREATLRHLLNRAARRTPELEVFLLCWDFALFYLWEREWLPVYNLGWRTHRRVRFELDGAHAPGGCHHQKIVVIDDDIAFCGGIDLTIRRWDTPEHATHDPRRTDPRGERYPPFHDVQLALQGNAARALGELCRERWRNATGEPIQAVSSAGRHDAWPPCLDPDLSEVDVAIARTMGPSAGRPAVREVERLYCALIAAAERYIYIENQFLTATVIRDALTQRLRCAHGPEIVIVGPQRASGWLENSTMDVMRARVVEDLRRADAYGRLHLYTPVRSSANVPVYVHAKVMIVDDRWVRVGSANLCNRSMSLDSECDVLFDARDRAPHLAAVRRFRDRLIAEHLDRPVDEVARALSGGKPIHVVVAELGSRDGTRLEPLEVEPLAWLEDVLSENPPFDPDGPMDASDMFDQVVPQEHQRLAGRLIWRGALLLGLLLGLAAAWRWTPLAEWIDPRRLASELGPLRDSAWAPPLVLAAYLTAALTFFPVTLLIVQTGAVFGPLLGILYSLAGLLFAAAVTFGAGRMLGRRTVRRMAGSRLNKISRRLARGGILGVVLVRVLPVAPFTIVNLVGGASHLRFRAFAGGTAIGMLPGLLALNVLSDRLMHALRAPSPASISALGAVAGAVVVAGLLLSRWLRRKHT